MTASVGPEGGFLVPPEFVESIERLKTEPPYRLMSGPRGLMACVNGRMVPWDRRRYGLDDFTDDEIDLIAKDVGAPFVEDRHGSLWFIEDYFRSYERFEPRDVPRIVAVAKSEAIVAIKRRMMIEIENAKGEGI